MKKIIIFLFISLIPIAYLSKAENQLYRDILSNYSKLVRPVRNASHALNVEMKVFLQQIMGLDGKNQIIELNAWLKFIWMDYRMTWDPNRYEGITSIRFAGGENQIWRPDILLYNSASEEFDSTFKSNEVVYNTGEINWVPPGIFRASCKMDITYFPFDRQTCYLKFGSWTYHGNALDLHISQDVENKMTGMDLSTYTPSGEWDLISAPGEREVTYTACCPEPYSTVTFYMILRRRTIFYLFNIVLPSLLVSTMTLMGFCLPAHDMSEKIGYQTTILLSICFFVTIVSETTPPTSEAVPLLGMFFSTLTLLISLSTAFTITVLNLRYRQTTNTKMSPTFHKVFLEWIPWFLMMKRPGTRYKRRKAAVKTESLSSIDSLEYAGSMETMQETSFETTTTGLTSMNPLLKKLDSIPTENLQLNRKVGTGIFKNKLNGRKTNGLRSNKRMKQIEKYVTKFTKEYSQLKTNHSEYVLRVVSYYQQILMRLRQIRTSFEEKRNLKMRQEDWKYAALVLDRFCLVLFTIFISICLIAIFCSTPQLLL
ncbi:unnamed protein product [Auanema sp. JU1783]|nr:unnamed protein product [Auanema sp. JU1783]